MNKAVRPGAARLAPIALPGLPVSAAAGASSRLIGAPRGVFAAPRADITDPAKLIAELTKAHEDFKAEYDAKLKSKADVVTDQKVEKINSAVDQLQAAVDELNKKLAAAALVGGGKPGQTPDQAAYSKAFEVAFRRGSGEEELKALAVKASMSTQSDPDGGWMVPTEMEKTIDRILMTVSAMRQLATVRPISTSEYKKLVSQGGATSGWVGETDARGATNTPQLAQIAIEAMELYALPYATQSLLDDAVVDIGQWLGDEVSITFSEQEGASFITGNGVKKPRGIQGYTAVADANYAWGKIGYVGTGGAAFAADPAGLDSLISALYALKNGYRQNATWMMNRKTIGVVRTMKDSQGHYAWQPSTQAGQPPTLLGYPVADDDNMDDLGANKFPVAVADWKRAYTIVDRVGTRVLRDPYSNKPYVGFYTTKRVGGGVTNFEAIKLVKCA
jgi:HK97 family phage major capsid protein